MQPRRYCTYFPSVIYTTWITRSFPYLWLVQHESYVYVFRHPFMRHESNVHTSHRLGVRHESSAYYPGHHFYAVILCFDTYSATAIHESRFFHLFSAFNNSRGTTPTHCDDPHFGLMTHTYHQVLFEKVTPIQQMWKGYNTISFAGSVGNLLDRHHFDLKNEWKRNPDRQPWRSTG